MNLSQLVLVYAIRTVEPKLHDINARTQYYIPRSLPQGVASRIPVKYTTQDFLYHVKQSK